MDTLAGGTRWEYPLGPANPPAVHAEYLPLRDHLGSTVLLMTATRTGDLAQFYGAEPSAQEGFGLRIAESFDYDPYGWPTVHAPSGSPAKFGDPVVGLLAIRSGQVGALEGTMTTAPLLSSRELWQWYTNTPGNDPMLTESETTRAPQSTVGWRHLYTARPWEPQTRSYHYRHRWYDPHQARFLSRDPIGYGDGLLQYAYVGGDPIGRVDPLGLELVIGGNGPKAPGYQDWVLDLLQKIVGGGGPPLEIDSNGAVCIPEGPATADSPPRNPGGYTLVNRLVSSKLLFRIDPCVSDSNIANRNGGPAEPNGRIKCDGSPEMGFGGRVCWRSDSTNVPLPTGPFVFVVPPLSMLQEPKVLVVPELKVVPPPEVILAHELNHLAQYDQGLDRGAYERLTGNKQDIEHEAVGPHNVRSPSRSHYLHEGASGVSSIDGSPIPPYTENDIRNELGIVPRTRYN